MWQTEMARIRGDLETCRGRLVEAERRAAERGAAAALASQHHEEAKDYAHHAHCQLQLLRVSCYLCRIAFHVLFINVCLALTLYYVQVSTFSQISSSYTA